MVAEPAATARRARQIVGTRLGHTLLFVFGALERAAFTRALTLRNVALNTYTCSGMRLPTVPRDDSASLRNAFVLQAVGILAVSKSVAIVVFMVEALHRHGATKLTTSV